MKRIFSKKNGELICLYFPLVECLEKDGIKFYTENQNSLQFGSMFREKGHYIDPHVHLPTNRKINLTAEVIFLISGKLRVDLFEIDRTYLESFVAESQSIIYLYSGGHGFEIIESCKMVEIKQGPYIQESDKARFKFNSDFL